MRNLAFIYIFASKTLQCLVHRSLVLRVPHDIKSLKHKHSRGPCTIHLPCQQYHLTNMAVSSIPTSKGKLVASSLQAFKGFAKPAFWFCTDENQPHSKTSVISLLGPTQTHIHIWILTSVPQVFSVLKFSLIYGQPKTEQSISSLQPIKRYAYISNIQK